MSLQDQFSIGMSVIDRDSSSNDAAVVVNLPPIPAEEFIVYPGNQMTVADDNPEYNPESNIVIVIFEENLTAYRGEYDRKTPLSLSWLSHHDIPYYAFPPERLIPVDEHKTRQTQQQNTDTEHLDRSGTLNPMLSSSSDGSGTTNHTDREWEDDDEKNGESDSPEDDELAKLYNEAEQAANDLSERETSASTQSQYNRSDKIKQYALTRADGYCEFCAQQAPFRRPDDTPYLEIHHVHELGEGGSDHPSNVAALCPTCHREIHYGKDGIEKNEQLNYKIDDRLAEIGTEDID